jgi:hypothetical protein
VFSLQAWYKKYFTPQKMMRTVLLSTLLPILFGIYLYGWRVLALLLVVTAAGVATEFLFQRHYKKKISEAVFVSCILYTLTLPPSMPFWMAVIGIVFGLFFGKLVFGGFGANPFNPALVARAFVYVNFPEPMTISWTQNAHGLPGGFARFLLPEIDAVTEATPMILFNNTGSTQPLGDMIFGNIPGAIGETSVLIILIAAAYLIWKKVASWEVMAGGVVSFIFGGKAAPGYFRAKGVIKYINEIAKVINNDESIKGKIKVVFVTNYRVSYGEKLFPAADISEQISTAGKEASGTGNMKFMLNATPTIGTMDGANVEIVEEAGAENNFIFGATVEEIREKRGSYDPVSIYNNQPDVKRVVDSLVGDELNDAGSYMFLDIYNSLVKPNNGESPDQYFVLHDFASYKEAQKEVDKAYRDRQAWAKKCLINMANAGKFSSDRTIKEYAEEIWGIEPAEIEVNQ